MPATPARPPSSLPRLYIDQPLAAGETQTLEGQQAHYLVSVMRLGSGAQVKLFDNISGEWLAEIIEAGKRRVSLRLTKRLRERDPVPDLWLLFAPIKRGRTDWIVEKATELGVARLFPVRTQRTIVGRVNVERLRAHMIEAAEQCERTALPELEQPQELESLLQNWPDQRTLFFADEMGGAPLLQAASGGPAAILIGPEGGLTDQERRALLALPEAKAVSLGPRILRADTAALAAISLWMGGAGDWGIHANR